MGACLNGRKFDSLEEARDMWDGMVDESLYEDGHSYSGGIGMLGHGFKVVSFVANDVDEADDYIADNHQKWSRAMCVKIKDGSVLVGGWCSE